MVHVAFNFRKSIKGTDLAFYENGSCMVCAVVHAMHCHVQNLQTHGYACADGRGGGGGGGGDKRTFQPCLNVAVALMPNLLQANTGCPQGASLTTAICLPSSSCQTVRECRS